MKWPWSRRAAPEPTPEVAKAASSGGFSSSKPPSSPAKPAGADGIVNVGGFLVTGERDRDLAGINKWTTFDNALLNIAIVSSASNIWTQLAGSAKWTVEPNKSGGSDAKRAAEIAEQGLLNAQLTTPWRQTVRRQSMKRFRGFSMHEVLLRRRATDDMVVVGDIQDRPPWTIWRWNRPDPQAEWIGVEQQTPTIGNSTWYIPRERLFYSVENTLSPSPDGVGLLRQMADPIRRLQLFRRFEGIGFQTDLSGVPVARAPLAKLQQELGTDGLSPAEIKAKVLAEVGWIHDLLRNHNKNAEQGILLDSATYTSKDPGQTPSSIYEYAFDLIKGQSASLAAIGQAIGREIADIARIMCAEWLLLGAQDSGGAYSMHEDKTAMFGLCVNSVLEDIADDANRDIVARLLVMNGLDPEVCMPRLVPEPVATGSVTAACQALAALFQAGLNPTDKAINVLRGRLNLPPAPDIDETDLLLPRGTEVERLGPDGRIEAVDPTTGSPVSPPGGAGTVPAAADPGQAGAPAAVGKAVADPGDDDLTDDDHEDLDQLVDEYGVDDAPDDDEDLEKYSPDQARDGIGRWTAGGGGGSSELDRAKGQVAAAASKLKDAKAARKDLAADAKGKLRSAKGAAATAKKSPTTENKAAARKATTAAARAAAKLGKHDAKIDAHAQRHADAKGKLAEARAAARGGKPAVAGGYGGAASTSTATAALSADDAKPVADHDLESMRESLATKLSPEESEALLDYTSNSDRSDPPPLHRDGGIYRTINESLRGQRQFGAEDSSAVEHIVKNMDAALGKARIDKPVLTYRVADASLFAHMKPGEIVVDHGFASTSTDRQFVLDYADSYSRTGPALLSITSPSGTKLGAIPGGYGQEKELLLARGSATRLDRTESKRIGGKEFTVLHMTVVGQR